MGFFSAVKKFFGGGTEEAKGTQDAAAGKDAAAAPVAPEVPVADAGSVADEPESTPGPVTVPAADGTVAPVEDASADDAVEDEAAPVAVEVEQVGPEPEAVFAADEPVVEEVAEEFGANTAVALSRAACGVRSAAGSRGHHRGRESPAGSRVPGLSGRAFCGGRKRSCCRSRRSSGCCCERGNLFGRGGRDRSGCRSCGAGRSFR